MQHILQQAIKIFSASAIRYFVIAGVPFLLFYKVFASHFKTWKIQERTAGRKDFAREMAYSLQATAVFAIAAIILLYSPIRKHTLIYSDLHDHSLWWIWGSLGTSLLIHDTYFYWMHRTLHHKNLFVHAHVLHHRSTNPSPWAAYSFHFWEACAESCVLFLIAFTIPIHPIALLLFTVTAFIINVYGHLGYEIQPKWFRNTILFEIMNTSTYHNLHHSDFKGNYGLYFRLWDRLLKTENPNYVKEYDRLQQKRFEIIKEA